MNNINKNIDRVVVVLFTIIIIIVKYFRSFFVINKKKIDLTTFEYIDFVKYDFIKFINNPKKYSSSEFIYKNKQIIKKINQFELLKCNFIKEKIKFNNKSFKKIYNHSPGLPIIETILNNPNHYYIIKGGIRSAGARYPDYIINKTDILYLKDVMEKYGIMKISNKNIKEVVEKCILLVQEKLNTNLFNDIKTGRWAIFDNIIDNFRNHCLDIENFSEYKGYFIPTSLSMLLYLMGDCREHSIFLTYLMRIYLYYNDNEQYIVTPIYTKSIETDYEHTFPILINKKTKDIVSIDALNHKTNIVSRPPRENNFQKIIFHKKNIYKSGYFREDDKLHNLIGVKNKPWIFELVKWYSEIPCEYITTNELFNDKTVIVYGMLFKRPNIKYAYDTKFNKLITKNLINARLCRPI